jgi:pimeloyl-ACP methyl ester carboxylesterase
MPKEAIRSMGHSMMTYAAATALKRYLASPAASARAIVAPPNAWPFSLHVLVPAVEATVIPDVGHWLMLDKPRDFIAALEAAAG